MEPALLDDDADRTEQLDGIVAAVSEARLQRQSEAVTGRRQAAGGTGDVWITVRLGAKAAESGLDEGHDRKC